MTADEVAELAASRRWSPNALIGWVYSQAGLKVNSNIDITGSVNDIRYRTDKAENAIYPTVEKFDSFEDLVVGDVILARNEAVASYLSKSREGFQEGDPFVAQYTVFVYLGNETFACGENGGYTFRFMTFDDFDDPATTDVKESFADASTDWEFTTRILRFSNLIGG